MTTRWEPIHRLLRPLGFDVVRHPGPATLRGRRLAALRAHGVDLVVDVGANVGQYASELRSLGYRGEIVSLEPEPRAFARLLEASARDPRWRALRLALGDFDGRAPLNVADDSVNSSLLSTLPAQVEAEPRSTVVGEVEVEVRRLDSICGELVHGAERPLLKLDVQGYELRILQASPTSLDRFVGLEVELSLVPLYAGGALMGEAVEWLEGRGFWLTELEPEFSDPRTGRLLQVNGMLFRAREDAPPGIPEARA